MTGLQQLGQPSVAAQHGPVLWVQIPPSRPAHDAADAAHTVPHDGAGAVDTVPHDGARAEADSTVSQLMHQVSVACEWVQVLESQELQGLSIVSTLGH